MQIKTSTLFIALLSTSLLTTTFISCNNDGAKKEEKVEAPATPTTAMPDTPKMTAAPAKDTMPKKDTLKKGGIKPVNTKPAVPPPTGG